MFEEFQKQWGQDSSRSEDGMGLSQALTKRLAGLVGTDSWAKPPWPQVDISHHVPVQRERVME
jgi:hypothetical protein